ncbi:hypothetical protein PybrP1_004431 [[Pythium] brassicae (nom. inval.)]|nr:hypothetical protein PybrP1_004431 [[Pythium] brassicae (nom. inval.)]
MRWLRRAWHGANAAVPRTSWSVYHPNARRTALHPPTKLTVKRGSRVAAYTQTHLHPSALQRNVTLVTAALAVTSAAYQFLTNLHTVPITGRTQVVVLTNEEECDMGTKAANAEVQKAHLFPREYDWRVSLVDDPANANACCYPGGKIVVYTGILDMVDYAVEKGICKSKHDALAVILSHEIGHALARHTAESMSFLPLLYLQALLGLESPLLQYIFEYAFNLPFSRKQETEADHIGLMLMASACYDPTEAPRLWRAFARFHAMLANDGAEGEEDGDEDELDLDFDFFSTHPSNAKREAMLQGLVQDALELQRKASWCASLKEKVQQLVTASESEFLLRLNVFRAQQRVARRATVGTLHGLENEEVFKLLRDDKEKQLKAATATEAAA